MKRRVFAGIILAVILLAVVAAAFFLFAAAVGLVSQASLTELAGAMGNGIGNSLITACIGFVLLGLVAGYILLDRGRGGKRDEAPASAVISSDENGTAFISLSAVDSIVQTECRKTNGVLDCISSILNREEGISIGIRLAIIPGMEIPSLASALKTSLKEKVELWTGVNVCSVDVLVEQVQGLPDEKQESVSAE